MHVCHCTCVLKEQLVKIDFLLHHMDPEDQIEVIRSDSNCLRLMFVLSEITFNAWRIIS